MLPLGRCALFLPLLLLWGAAPSFGFFSWFTRTATPAPAPDPTPPPDPGNLGPVPFEMTTADEGFLAEAQRWQLSPLDACHHKVIAQLRSSCTALTEEELAKLGVSLFNCQASVEGRRTYLCSADMTLAECTAEMDPDTWNAYHIVSNRARAVCYATRQMQFKRRAEHTVNALVSTAVGQLEAMKALKSGQEELKTLTSESLEKVASGQQDLLVQQERFQNSQEQMEASIQGNLAQLAEEKALIASGQQQVAQLIEGIMKRMENVSGHLNTQGTDLRDGHQAILKDLAEVQRGAQEVYAKIEIGLGSFLTFQNQTTQYYEELMKKLQKLNQSLGLVLSTMERMQSKLGAQLQHIQRFITWAGFSLSSIYTCVLHGSYFLLAALIMTFLQIPGLPRAVLLILVVANALFELNQGLSWGFHSLTSLLVFTVAGDWVLRRFFQSALRRKRISLQPSLSFPQKMPGAHPHEADLKQAKRCRVTSTPEREGDVGLLKEELDSLEEVSYLSEGSRLGKEAPEKGADLSPFPRERVTESTVLFSADWKPREGPSVHQMSLRRISLARSTRHETSLERFHHHRGLRPFPDSRTSSPNESMASDMSTGSASGRPFCQAVTRTGQPCRKKALPGHAFCHVHDSGQVSYLGQLAPSF
uniref:Protein brambleberry-like isoform X1 n=1 Tax=Pogona vitticeps TaxID=103695 RepID=A0ABM5GDJ1_9SAUR